MTTDDSAPKSPTPPPPPPPGEFFDLDSEFRNPALNKSRVEEKERNHSFYSVYSLSCELAKKVETFA